MIYRHSLVVSLEIVPYSRPHERTFEHQQARAQYHSPTLLALNKTYGQEARIVLYGDNKWRLNHAKEPPTIFYQYPHLFRNIIVALSQIDSGGPSQIAESLFWHRTRSMTTREARRLTEELHRRNLARMMEDWVWRRELLDSMRNICFINTELKILTCPSGCCRLGLLRQSGIFYQEVLKMLTPRYLAVTCPATEEMNRDREPGVIVRDLVNWEERQLIYEHYDFMASEDELRDGDFLQAGLRWLIRP